MSDQYHFIPPPPEFHDRARKALVVVLAVFAVALFCAVFAGCAEREPLPTPAEQIRGAWERKWLPGNITGTYHFGGDGQCLTYTNIPAQPVHFVAYFYEVDGDALRMLDLAEGLYSVAEIDFPTDSTMVLAWESGLNYFLKRL